MATRYQEYVNKMLDEQKIVFDTFRKIHDEYQISGEALQEKFNEVGTGVLRIIQDYEDKLCSNQERGMYNKFSSTLSEKFRAEIKKIFPMIDHIGLKIEKAKTVETDDFSLKKINLL